MYPFRALCIEATIRNRPGHERRTFRACRKEGLFECALWIDAGLRVPYRDESCEVEPSDCDVTINNNGGPGELAAQLRRWCRDVGVTWDG